MQLQMLNTEYENHMFGKSCSTLKEIFWVLLAPRDSNQHCADLSAVLL